MAVERDGALMAGPSPAPQPLELWAGIECTVNRVGDLYLDQVERSGHASRIDDLDLFAALGVRTVRYPVLWERTAPDGLEHADWSWPDARLHRLRTLGIAPIVGLVHHGSGPRSTSLLDPGFAAKLAAYAASVAARYPWVDAYTPVNEPLTTARFSALYGHWYPHARSDLAFARALLAQCRAVVLAMRAIRVVNAGARLVQTDDLGYTWSTPALAAQAAFENERRWLTWDLLCGRMDRHHRLWGWLRAIGVAEAELTWFTDNPCPPDVLGVNHYLSGERFLDERIERYPADSHGGNGRDRYADVLAARVLVGGAAGPQPLLHQAWQRFHLPIAITEAHNGCTREEQLRWLLELWDAARRAGARGVDVKAVTVWSWLGTHGWDNLVTEPGGQYEPGVFDVRAPRPRPTAVATLVRELATGQRPTHPVLASPGWWRRRERLHFPPVSLAGQSPSTQSRTPAASGRGRPRPLLVVGAAGTLGRATVRLCQERGLPCIPLRRADVDITHGEALSDLVERLRPWAIVNAAGYVRVDDAEADQVRCHRENVVGPTVLAETCARHGLALVTFSSDLVFDGQRSTPYVEHDTPAPLNVYGRTKAEAEARVLAILPSALVVRTSAFFGPWDAYNFVHAALRTLTSESGPFVAADDAVVSPTYVPHLVQAYLDLLIDGERGVWHLANLGAVTWYQLALSAAQAAGADASRLEGRPTAALHLAAARPRYSALASEHGQLLPSLEAALAEYVAERPWEETEARITPAAG